MSVEGVDSGPSITVALVDTLDDLLVVHVARQTAYWTLGAFLTQIERVTTEPRLDQQAEVESAAQSSVTSGRCISHPNRMACGESWSCQPSCL